jgi:hypothetical protein
MNAENKKCLADLQYDSKLLIGAGYVHPGVIVELVAHGRPTFYSAELKMWSELSFRILSPHQPKNIKVTLKTYQNTQ